MARTNRPTRSVPNTHTTFEGAPALHISAEEQLRRSVMSCLLWEDTFYEGGVTIAERITSLVEQLPLETVAAIAMEARERMFLRHVPLLIVYKMTERGGTIVGDTLARVIQRPDELTEFVSLFWKMKGGRAMLPAQVKRGLGEAFKKFDAYQLAKYNRDTEVKLRDVLFLSHPKPQDAAQEAMWASLVDGTLPAPDTWEVALSGGKDKRETWERLIEEKKLGGLALLRNLRNMQEANVPDSVIRQAIDDNPFKRVLPFRFLAAAEHAPSLEAALERAMFRGVQSLEPLPGKTAILVDVSGSMTAALSNKSRMSRLEAACGVAIMLREMCDDVDVITFGTDAELIPARRGFALRDAIHRSDVGHATNTDKGKAIADSRGYNRIVVITDAQSATPISGPRGGRFDVNGLPTDNAPGYFINVAPYQIGIGYGVWTTINGWSESVVRYIQEVEKATAPVPA